MKEKNPGMAALTLALAVGISGISGISHAQLDTNRFQTLDQDMHPTFRATVNARFGAAVAAADFNGDGFTDLAVGIPLRTTNVTRDGAVQIFCGTSTGLEIQTNLFLYQAGPGVADSSEFADWFGKSLAAGDFNGDGRDDLVIGVPNEDVPGAGNSGVIHVLNGQPGPCPGPQRLLSGSRVIMQGQPAIADAAESNDQFGTHLTVGDFDGDGFDDVAVGIPQEDVGGVRDAGAVHVFRGSPSGLGLNDTLYHRGHPTMGGLAEGDRFGQAVLAADLGGDGLDDLIVGVTGDDGDSSGTDEDEGAVQILPGTPGGGPSPYLNSVVRETSYRFDPSFPPYSAERGDRFGWALAAGRFDGSRFELAIGAPLDDRAPATPNTGMVQVQHNNMPNNLANTVMRFYENGNLAQRNDKFGERLAIGDFDGNGSDDLVVGNPRNAGSGEVVILYFRDEDGRLAVTPSWFHPADFVDPAGTTADNAFFGRSLAVGDFDGDGIDDLAIGSPRETVTRAQANGIIDRERAGRVVVLFGARP